MPSTSLTRLRSIARYGIKPNVAGLGLQDSAKIVSGQGKFVSDSYKFFSSLPDCTLTDLNIFLRPGTVFAGGLEVLVNRERKISVVGTLSRTFSIPSVSGPAYQVCGYQIDRLLSDSTCLPRSSEKQKFPMAAIVSSKALFGDSIVHKLASVCATLKHNATIPHHKKCFGSCMSASMCLRNREQPNHDSIYGYFLFHAVKSGYRFYLHSLHDSKEFHSSSASSITAEAATDVTFDSSLGEHQQGNASESAEKVPSDRALNLRSGSCYLPHPDKEETGGEDAHFICAEEQAIGVADGVGGWAELGVDAGLYARELMSNSVTAIQEEPKGSIDPARVLEKAHSSTTAKGSSTACIIALTEQGLHAINLGDSGFIVVRDGCTVFRSPVQQHGFNFPYQLESGNAGDLPSCGQVFSVPVAPGDVIIAGTDGLFDNLYNSEVTAVVVHALRAGLGPQVTAQKIAALARQRAQDRDRQTPFSTAAQDVGFRYYGGKLDDITVVVSFISTCDKEEKCSPPAHGSS